MSYRCHYKIEVIVSHYCNSNRIMMTISYGNLHAHCLVNNILKLLSCHKSFELIDVDAAARFRDTLRI